jgi:hypothetical protein
LHPGEAEPVILRFLLFEKPVSRRPSFAPSAGSLTAQLLSMSANGRKLYPNRHLTGHFRPGFTGASQDAHRDRLFENPSCFNFPGDAGDDAQHGAGGGNTGFWIRLQTRCAYAVEDLAADYGSARAATCLRLAAKSDPRLNSLSVDDSKVEAFAADKDAYLLIDSAEGVILAFRGTLAPSLALASTSLQEVAGRVIFGDNSKLRHELMTFVRDWVNDAFIAVDEKGRHLGFYGSWRALRTHLEKPCDEPPRRDCSVSGSFLPPGATPKKPFITGHSKGGAVALMAVLNPSDVFTNAQKPVVYSFASAKGVDLLTAKNSGEVNRAILLTATCGHRAGCCACL